MMKSSVLISGYFSGKPDLEFFNAQENEEQCKPGQDPCFQCDVTEAVYLQHDAFL